MNISCNQRLLLLVSIVLLASPGAFGQVTEEVLYTFTGPPDGSAPYSNLLRDKSGNLYGVTASGGANRQGTVFELSPAKQGGWTETILHSFNSNGDGYSPGGGLTMDKAGNLYGTTIFGGAHVFGTVFKLSPSRGGEWNETILFNFTGGNDGGLPQYCSLIFDRAGNLYGTTQNGGAYGYGVAYELSPSPNGGWTETVLHAFAENATDGGYPMGLVFDKTGNLYGTAALGGSFGRGVVFELSPAGGTWTATILHNFAEDNSDGGHPVAGVIFRGNQLYGTTEYGGPGIWGTVYRMHKTKTGWSEQILHGFTGGADGWIPQGELVFDKAGNFYGVTEGGGSQGSGTVFELTRSKGTWNENVLYNFTGGSDGGDPSFGLTFDPAGNLYGTAGGGGNNQNGVVFEVKR